MCKLAWRLKQAHCLIPNLSVPQARRPDWGATPRPALHREYWIGGLIYGEDTLSSILKPFLEYFEPPTQVNPAQPAMQLIVLASSVGFSSARAVTNQAKNHVTSRVRLDEKYAARRALMKAACQNLSSRVFAEYFSRKRCPARVQLSGNTVRQKTNSPAHTFSQATHSPARIPINQACFLILAATVLTIWSICDASTMYGGHSTITSPAGRTSAPWW